METSTPSLFASGDDKATSTALIKQSESKVQWRLGVGNPKAKQLLLRYAVDGDHKKGGAAQRSNYYRKYGNPNKRPAVAKEWRENAAVVDKNGGESGLSGTSERFRGRTWREKPRARDLR